MRPSRRFGYEAMGSKRKNTTSLLVAVDTSGSISDEELALALGFIQGFFKYAVKKLDIVQFDTQVYPESLMSIEKRPKQWKVHGRGGTDFNDVFKFTQDESRTMVTLWSIFRAPLIIGTDLPQLDDFSLSLLTNEEILAMNKNPLQAYQASSSCNENIVIWVNECPDQKSYYECIFNLSDEVQTVKLNLKVGNHDNIRDLWERKDLGNCSEFVLEPHSCKALKISL